MSDDAPGSPPPALAATCAQCGGTVEVRLSGPPARCPYCEAPEPLEPELARRVGELRERLAAQARRERQLVGKQAELGSTYGYCFLGAILSVWVVCGGGLALWALTEPPPGWSTWTYLTTPYVAAEVGDDHVMKWWACYAVITGFLLTSASWLAVLVSLRRVVRWAYPLPPDAPGRPPRCRCCGGELGPAGVVRRCGFCEADHVVTGERYQAREVALEERLRVLERQLEDTLAARNQRIERLFGLAGGLPLAVGMGAPLLGLVLTRTRPELWAIPGGLLALALLLALWAEAWRPPEIPSLKTLQAGDGVSLRGERVTVLGILSLGIGAPALHLVGVGDAPTAAFQVRFDDDDTPRAYGFAVTEGGEPLEAADIPRGERLDLRRARGLGALAGRETVWGRVVMDGKVVLRARLVLGKPRAGKPPTYTVAREGPLSEADLTIAERSPTSV